MSWIDSLFSKSKSLFSMVEEHDIQANGYDFGRDLLVGNATGSIYIDTLSLTNGSTYEGTSSSSGFVFAL